jgi:translation initiation factor 2 subunit 3
MAKSNIKVSELPQLNVGVVGHIDHGKTTLLSKLTGKFADTHSEELKRGITIKLGYADMIIYKNKDEYSTKEGEPVRYVSFIDAPGHEMLMATMLSGAALMDAALLVIAANEGIQPQTREHFIALKAKNIRNVIILQNKIDLVSEEQAMKSYKEIKEFVKGSFAENAPIIPVSAQQEVNIDTILKFLAEIKIPERDIKSDPLFLVARSFDINRPGTVLKSLNGGVLGGILKKGKLKVGDNIEIKPGLSKKKGNETEYKTLNAEILGLFRGNEKVEEVVPGVSVAIETSLDPFLTKTDSLSGCVVGLQGSLPALTNEIILKTEFFDEVLGMKGHQNVDKVKTNEVLMLSLNTSITVGMVTKIKNNEVTLNLKIPVVDIKRENAAIARNINGHWRLIGFGEVI